MSNEGGGWNWGGLWSSVKEASTKIVEIYKEDLTEFTTTIKGDAAKAIEIITTQDNNDANHDEPEDELEKADNDIQKESAAHQDSEKKPGEHMFSSIFSVIQSGIGSLVNEYPENQGRVSPFGTHSISASGDLAMALNNPLNEKEYNSWLESESIDLNEKTDEISEFLAKDDELRKLHTQIVPSQMSYGDFWKRFFFLRYEQKKKEEQRQKLLQRAQEAMKNDVEIGWDDDDEEIDVPSTNPDPKPANEEKDIVTTNIIKSPENNTTSTEKRVIDEKEEEEEEENNNDDDDDNNNSLASIDNTPVKSTLERDPKPRSAEDGPLDILSFSMSSSIPIKKDATPNIKPNYSPAKTDLVVEVAKPTPSASFSPSPSPSPPSSIEENWEELSSVKNNDETDWADWE